MHEDDVVKIAHRAIDESPRIGRVEGGIKSLEIETTRHGIMIEALRSDMHKVIEVVMENSRKLDDIRDVKDSHAQIKDRPDAIEDGLRRHVRNRRVHRSVDP